jgi:predicted GTPase
MEKMGKKQLPINVCVIGITGAGKSSTCNTLCNDYKK